MRIQNFPLMVTTVAATTVMLLSACGEKQAEPTVGQTIDSTIEKAEQKTDQAVAAVKEEADAAKESTSKTIDSASVKLKDAGITTSINAELAKDSALSALKINVDTVEGRVSLRGSAPDSIARDHATELAKRVDGVVSVDNQLMIKN